MKKWIWYTVSTIFILGISIFAYGFGQAISIGIEVNQAPGIVQPAPEMTVEPQMVDGVLAMGDSLARGTGDETGEGFVGYVVRGLESSNGEPLPLYNIAVEGLGTQALLSQINDPQTREGIRSSSLILISIGGNDLRAIERVESTQRSQYFKDALDIYIGQLGEIIGIIRAENKGAPIVFIGLYNLDYSPSNQERSEYLIEWNQSTQKVLESFEGTLFTPTYDLFKLNLEDYISADGLHPNSKGYAAIGDRILRNLGIGKMNMPNQY